jgi:formamidopyrimidine-DNA glycosylase
MPELPEVETIVCQLRPRLQERRILSFESLWEKKALPSSRILRQALVGKKIVTVSRRAKYLLFRLEDNTLFVIHLGMTGRLYLGKNPRCSYVRAWFGLDRGLRLYFCDARKFGRIQLLDRYQDLDARLGVEPLSCDFTPGLLHALLKKHSRSLKLVLLDQGVIAGLGNIYTDEALFWAKLSPRMPSCQITQEQARRLCLAIRKVLREGIRCNGTSFDWVYQGGEMQQRLRVYQRQGDPCRRCGRTIEYFKMAGRGTHICPCCQEEPRGSAPKKPQKARKRQRFEKKTKSDKRSPELS